MSKNLTWADVLAACQQYNIPPTAKIELATSWECSPIEADSLYYNFQKNKIAIANGCDNWYKTADWILIGKLKEILNK